MLAQKVSKEETSTPATTKATAKEPSPKDTPDLRFRIETGEASYLFYLNLSANYHPFTKPSFLKGTGAFAEAFTIFGYSVYKYSWDEHTYYIQRSRSPWVVDGPFHYYTERTNHYFRTTAIGFGLGLNIPLYERQPRANFDFLYSLSLRGSTGILGVNDSHSPEKYDFGNLYFKGGGDLGILRVRVTDDFYLNLSAGAQYLVGVNPQQNAIIYSTPLFYGAVTGVWGAKKEMQPWIPIHTQEKTIVQTETKIMQKVCPPCKKIVRIIPEVREKVERVRIQFILDLINGLYFPAVQLPTSSMHSHKKKYRALIYGLRNGAPPKKLDWLIQQFKFFVPKGTIIKLFEISKKLNSPKLQWVHLTVIGRGKDEQEAKSKIFLIKAFLNYAGINLGRMGTKVANGKNSQHLIDFEINVPKSLQKARQVLPKLLLPDLRPQALNYSRRFQCAAFNNIILGKLAPGDERKPIGAWNFRLGLEASPAGFSIRTSDVSSNYMARMAFHYEHENSRLNPFVTFGFRTYEKKEDHYHLYLGGGLKWTVFDSPSQRRWSFFSRLDLQAAALAVFRPYWGWETVGYWVPDSNAYAGYTYKTREEKRLLSSTSFAMDFSLNLNLFSARVTPRDRIDFGISLGWYYSPYGPYMYPHISFPIAWRREYNVPLYPFLKINEKKIRKIVLTEDKTPCPACPPPIIKKQPIIIQRRDISLALTIINNLKLPTIYFETAVPQDPSKVKNNQNAIKYDQVVKLAEITFEAIPYEKIKPLFRLFFREEEIKRLWEFAQKINSPQYQWIHLNVIGKASTLGEGVKGVDNLALSDRRARLCYSFLLLCGVNASRIELVSAGVKRPNVVVKEQKDHAFNQAGVFEIDFEKSNAAFKQSNPQHFIQVKKGAV